MLKVVLIGYGSLAQSLMMGIIESGHQIAGVLRWKEGPLPSPIKNLLTSDNFTHLIKAANINEIKTKKVNSKKFIKEIKKLAPDIILVGSWGEILKQEIIDLPKIACINCHPSLLPYHRGSNPYASAIIQGETKTGITFHLMTEGIDAGDILLQSKISISDNDTGGNLKAKCAYKAKELVAELLNKIQTAELIPKKQDESKASYFPRLIDEDAIITWSKPAIVIHNRIRALNPWMKCYTSHKDVFLFMQSTKIIELDNPEEISGKILSNTNGTLVISTSDPYKALMVSNIEVFGALNRFRSNSYINKKIKIGDSLS